MPTTMSSTLSSHTTTTAAALSSSSSLNLKRSPISKLAISFSPKTLTNAKPFTFKSSSNPLPALSPIASTSSSSATRSTITSKPKSLKSRLQNGDTLYGIFLLTFSPTVAEIAGLAGFDFAILDMEHGPGGITEALHCLRALAASQTPAILRLPESSPTWAKKALDLGPQGLMFPMIESPKMAREAVSYCRFPPEGIRGSAHTVVRASDYGMDEGYLSNYGGELLVMCQVESVEAVKNAEEIAAVDGVDCVQMGPLDLSANMGYLRDPGNKKVKEMLMKGEEAVLRCGRAYLSGIAKPSDGAMDLKSRGYHMMSGASDVGLFRNAAVEDVMRFKVQCLEKEGGRNHSKEDDDDEKYWSE
ncbi:hypothetical protein Tsubulata_017272 [Turnera subulata]|uniref:HpcH/HpaI aldolase/citrate lyase domain-containing protein n=1 Tax=Turnera subulata TaxID=218843 RepID=A0A9Q0GI99_9ROSI|nr:hypothetical protein Tsubulata_017272 [Turnera subulata]